MYKLDINKEFSNTTILKQFLDILTSSTQSDKIEVSYSLDKTKCTIEVNQGTCFYYIRLNLMFKDDNFLSNENGFNIEVSTDDETNTLEWFDIIHIKSVLDEYWRCVRPDLYCA